MDLSFHTQWGLDGIISLVSNWWPRPGAEGKDTSRTHILKRAANNWRLWTPPEGFNKLDRTYSTAPSHPQALLIPLQAEDWEEQRKDGLLVVSHPWRVESSGIFHEDRGALTDTGGVRTSLGSQGTSAYGTDIADLPTLWARESVLFHLSSPKGAGKEWKSRPTLLPTLIHHGEAWPVLGGGEEMDGIGLDLKWVF